MSTSLTAMTLRSAFLAADQWVPRSPSFAAYAEPFAFDVDEDAYDHLRARAEALLGVPIPQVRRRWSGVYSEVDPDVAGHAPYHRAEVEPGIVLVTGPGGRGMTCSPAIAEETFR